MSEKLQAAVEMGRLGGRSRSAAKIQAAQMNGKKGGRPRKNGLPKKVENNSGQNDDAGVTL